MTNRTVCVGKSLDGPRLPPSAHALGERRDDLREQRIETTMQADYTFGLGLKGFTWDTANGGKSPTSAELATGTNWDLVANSIKGSAGVITIGDAAK